MKFQKRRAAVGMLFAAALVLTGCASEGGNGDSNSGGDGGSANAPVVFVEAVGTSPQTLNPVVSTDVTVSSMSSAVYETLTRLDSAFDIIPGLAASWEVSNEGRTLSMTLQEGVTWHDGEPFTAADVKFNLEESLPLAPIGGSLAGYIESIETPDDLSVIVEMSEPFGPLMETLSGLKMLPAHLYQGTNIAANEHNNKPVGTGPFVFEEFVPGDRITLQKYENYWGNEPEIDTIVLAIMPDANARVLAVRAGDVDRVVPLYLDQAQLDQLSGDEFLLVPANSASSAMTMSFNTRVEPLDDPEVRRAIYQAIDRQAIADDAFSGKAILARGPIPPEFEWAIPEDVDFANNAPYDPEAAAAALDAAGYPVGDNGVRFSMDVSTMSGFATFQLTGEVIKSNLEEIGISVNLVLEDFNVHVENVYTQHNFGASLVEFSPYNDANLGVSRLYVCNPDDTAYVNPSGICDDEAQAGWDAAASSIDREVRAAGIAIAEQRAYELMYVVPLVNTYGVGVIRQDRWDGLDGFQTNLGGNTVDWTALKLR